MNLFSHVPLPQVATRRDVDCYPRFVAPPLQTPDTWVLDLLLDGEA